VKSFDNQIKNFKIYFLKEANISNDTLLLNQLDQSLDEKGVDKSSPIRNWFKTQYLKWFKSNVDDDKKPVIPHLYKEGEPEWMSREGIVDFVGFNDSQAQKISHMIDYFQSLSDIDLKSLYKEPLKVIEDKMSKWEKTMSKKMEKAKLSPLSEGTDFEVISETKDANGSPMRWVKLLTKKAFEFEGDSMGHCVGKYKPDREGSSIVSLYDSDNLPHVTIQILKNKIKQIKGKQNAAPIEKYVDACIKFVRYLTDIKGYKVIGDGNNIGMVEYSNNYYFTDSDKWKTIVTKIIEPKQQKAFDELKKRIIVVASEAHVYVLEYLKGLK
jgi:hypothetical protein